MSQHIIVAHIHAKAGRRDRVKTALAALLVPTRLEAGCQLYALHEDRDDPHHFLFYERWASRERWQAHMQSDHIAEYLKAVKGLIESSAVYEMIEQ
ncbi:MAG: putative quinol monooxygenase [Pseudomonadota bacterium]